jgi:hypothetical protein
MRLNKRSPSFARHSLQSASIQQFGQASSKLLWPVVLLLLTSCISDYGYGYGYGYDDPVAMMMRDLEAALLPVKVILAGAGLAMLLAGYKIYRFIIMVPGLLLGGLLGMAIGADDGGLMAIIGLLLGAAVGAVVALVIHDLMVFLTGAFIGVAVMGGAFLAGGDLPDPAFVVIAGLIGGVGLLVLSKTAIIFFTSAVGSLLFGMGVEATGLWLLLFFGVGVAVQYGLANALGDKVGLGTGPAAIGKAKTGVAGSGVKPLPKPKPALQYGQVAGGAAPVLTTSAYFIANEGQRINLTDQMTIGRGSDCKLRLMGRNVSRRHATLRHSDGSWYIQDQDSAGGTFVNGQRVNASRLMPGDQVGIGDHTLRFEMG